MAILPRRRSSRRVKEPPTATLGRSLAPAPPTPSSGSSLTTLRSLARTSSAASSASPAGMGAFLRSDTRAALATRRASLLATAANNRKSSRDGAARREGRAGEKGGGGGGKGINSSDVGGEGREERKATYAAAVDALIPVIASGEKKARIHAVKDLAHIAWLSAEYAQVYIGRAGLIGSLGAILASGDEIELKIAAMQSLSVLVRACRPNQDRARKGKIIQSLARYLDHPRLSARQWAAHALFFLLHNNMANHTVALRVASLRRSLELAASEPWDRFPDNEALQILHMLGLADPEASSSPLMSPVTSPIHSPIHSPPGSPPGSPPSGSFPPPSSSQPQSSRLSSRSRSLLSMQ